MTNHTPYHILKSLITSSTTPFMLDELGMVYYGTIPCPSWYLVKGPGRCSPDMSYLHNQT